MNSLAPDSTLHSSFAQDRRHAIDLVATLRARTIRIGLLGGFFYRPDPAPEYQMMKPDACLELLEEQVVIIDSVIQVLLARKNKSGVDQSIATWMAGMAAQNGEIIGALKHMQTLSQNVVNAVKAPNPAASKALGKALADHFTFSRDNFYHKVTSFCDQMWDVIESDRADDIRRAKEAANTISSTLARLEKIGKHVRLVSLNASVEASRVGEDGKGLAVIAIEFKSLAEEIQSLSASASGSIEDLLSNTEDS